MELYIDATNLIVGRLGTYVAKQALLGAKVKIFNSEKAIITGKKEEVLAKYSTKHKMGITKGPFLPRMPDRFVKRIIRGMLPYKSERGKNAYKNIICYIGVPEEFKDQKLETIKNADVSKMQNTMYVKVELISKLLGAKIWKNQ